MGSENYFLVGKEVEVGYKFRIMWNDICKTCKYSKICFNGKKMGHFYKVIEIRKTKSPVYCKLIEGPAYLAVVEESTVRLSVNTPSAVEGVSILYKRIKCSEYQCPYIKYCVSNGRYIEGSVYIEKIVDKLDCPIGLDLTLVEARPEKSPH